MSAHVSLNLLNSLLKKINYLASLAFYLFFSPNLFNKINNTGAQMLVSNYHRILKLLKNPIFGKKTS